MVFSSWSETASFFTSGSVPSQPDPPMLSEQFVYGLTISWIKRPNEDEFLLQMEDEATVSGHCHVWFGLVALLEGMESRIRFIWNF